MNPLLLNGLGVLGGLVLLGAGVGVWVWVAGVVREFRREVGDGELADHLAKVLERERQKDAENAELREVVERQRDQLHRMTAEASRFQGEIRGRLGIYRQ
ncbi:MAG TPA: hypothetical protein VGE74_08615 [Gemmata sp.]